MKEYLKLSLFISTFGFLKEMRPSEPFIIPYITGNYTFDVTEDQVNREVFPVGTYSYLAQIVLVFLIADLLRYKPLIIVTGLSGIIIWSMLLWTSTLRSLQVLEVVYGTYLATEIAYFSYIYAKVNREHYAKVTSHTRASILCGKFVSAVTGQILVYYAVMDYKQLNYISLAAQILAFGWAFFIPPVQRSLYFHKNDKAAVFSDVDTTTDEVARNDRGRGNISKAFILLWVHAKTAYTQKEVIQWSLWYAVGLAAYIQTINYVQVLWIAIDDSKELFWNGAVEAILTLCGAIVALLAGRLHAKYFKSQAVCLLILTVLAILEGLTIFLSTYANTLTVSYVGYVLFGVLYSFSITIASIEIAKRLMEDSFGLIFGINTLFALLIQTILTLTIVSSGFKLDVFGQFTTYGYFFIVLGVVYFIAFLKHVINKR